MCRKCGEPDRRGSSSRRRRRRAQLLEGAGGITTGGNGVMTGCVWCGCLLADVPGYLRVDIDGERRHLRIRRLEQDRIQAGGPYVLWNLIAACGPCNRARVYTELVVADGCYFGPATLEASRAARAAFDAARALEVEEPTA